MNEVELESLTSFENIKKTCWLRLYWSSEIYSYGKLIREYANYPKWLPLAINSDHSGPNFNCLYTKAELSEETVYYLGHNHSKNEYYNDKSKSNRFVTVISPFVFYRKKKNIQYDPSNIGTIAFPVHSDLNVDRVDYFAEYMSDLKKLDKKFHPITICLHQHDILNGNYKEFLNKGFDIVTAGNSHDERFVERFYSLIKSFKYVTSNQPGTIAFLSIEMNIPFFVYGKSDIKPPLIPENELKINPLYYELFSLLSLDSDGNIKTLPSKIRFELETMLGIHNTVSNKELSTILYKSLFLWIIKGKFVLWFFRRLNSYFRNRK